MQIMSITQNHLYWLEENFLYIRTWVLENDQSRDRDLNTFRRPLPPISGLTAVPDDIEQFLLRYYPVIRDWISTQEEREIAADDPATSFEDFLGRYEGGAV